MIYSGHNIARNLLSESDSRHLARKYRDTGFKSTDLVVLREAYNRIPMDNQLIREYKLDRNEVMALQIISEQTGEDPEEILLEFFGAIKKLGKAVGAAIASPFKAVAKAKKGRDQGATMWQSVKYGMTELPQLFKHGTHFGQGEATEKATKAYQKILSDFEKHSNQYLQKLTKAAKELSQSDFPNNARPEDFRMMLMGKEKFADVETDGLGGLLGAMLDIKQQQQEYVNSGGDKKVANQIIGRMRKMLQFYMGELHDTYQSLESKNRYDRPLVRNSTAVALMDLYYDSDYWYNQVCEGMYDKNGLLVEAHVEAQETIVEDPEDQKALEAATDGKSEKEIAQALMSDEGLEGLSDKQLKSMQMASGVLRPLLIGCLGAAIAALGIDMGGNALGNFEESQAVKDMMSSLEGERVGTIIKTVPKKLAEYFDIIDVKPGEGVTQVFGRIGGFTDAQVQDMSMGDFLAKMKELGMNPETMEGLMADPEAGFKFLETANPDAKVGTFLRGVTEIQNLEGAGVDGIGHEEITKLFNKDLVGDYDPRGFMDDEGEWWEWGKSNAPLTPETAAEAKIELAKAIETEHPGVIGAGDHPLSLSTGVGPKIVKIAGKAATKYAIKYTAKTFAAGKVSGMIGAAALPTLIATAGVGIATSGVAIAALRKFAKNRKKTVQAAIDLLDDIKGPIGGSITTDPELQKKKGGPMPDPGPDDEVQGIADKLPLDLFTRSLKDKPYDYDKADELADEVFKDPEMMAGLVQDTPPKPQNLTAGYKREIQVMTEELRRWNQLAGILSEDMDYDQYATKINQIASDSGLPELNDAQLGIGAQALNVTRGIGDVKNLPDKFAEQEFEQKIDELEKLIESMKLENNEAVRAMLDTLAGKVGLDPSNYKDLENDEYMAKLGETWNNDQAAWEDAMEEVEALKGKLAAAQEGLDEAEATIVQQSAEIAQLMDENGHLIAKNKRAKDALRRALDLAKRKDIKIGDLQTGLDQAEELNKMKDKEIADLGGELSNALEQIKNLQDRENELNSRLIDIRTLYRVFASIGKGKVKANGEYQTGDAKTEFNTKHAAKTRDSRMAKVAKTFKQLGKQYPALKDTGEIIQRSIDAGVTSADSGSGQFSKGSKKDDIKRKGGNFGKQKEAAWHRGTLMNENIHKNSMLSLLESISDENNHYDVMACEANLDLLESGKEVMMSEEEYVELKSFCEYEQLDYVFDVQVYGNGVVVRIIDDYNDYKHY